ncbi:MAG: TolC family protein [Chlamydiia bacterium]|nr:TolC family protein [Chlamydiia bacterium]
MKKKHLTLICSIALIALGCGDFRGAADPFSYTPPRPYENWRPRKKESRLPFTLAKEDFNYVEKAEPLSLAEVIDVALINNPSTKFSWANARVSAARYGQTLENYFILADGSGTASRFRSALFTGPMRSIVLDTLIAGDLNFSYLVFDFGKTRNTSKAALESLYNADWSHNREIQTVMQTVMGDYYNYLYEDEKLTANRADVVDAQVTLESVLEKLRNGTADMGEKVQATTQLLQAELNVVAQKQNVHNSYTQLAADMGVPSDMDIKLEPYPETIHPFKPEDLDQLIDTAVCYRPDLKAAESDVKAGQYLVKAAKSLYLPQLNATFDVGRSYYSGAGSNDSYHYQAQAALTFPIFQGFFIRNTVKAAQGELEKAQATLRSIQLSVVQQVANQRTDVELAQEAYKYATAFLDSAKEDYRINLAKYRAGTGTITELINAQTAVADARAKYVLSKRDWFTSVANLAYALGTLAPPDFNKESCDEKDRICPPPRSCSWGMQEKTPAPKTYTQCDNHTGYTKDSSPIH